ncbi:MAG: LysR family transcriptional regulator [Pseudomonadota bacterium]
MLSAPSITLDQWRALVAVVDFGSYACAAEKLHKSQSAITYAVQKIEALLNIKVFEIQGRKAIITATGNMLYRRAQLLLDEAKKIEQATKSLSAGWEPEIKIAVEILYPNQLLFKSLAQFSKESPHTRIEIIESVIGGTAEALLQGQADLAITPTIPSGFLGSPLLRLKLIPVAHPAHPLHQSTHLLSHRDLKAYRHLIVRDSGTQRTRKVGTVEVEQRWTFSHMATSIQAACAGYGFAWFPEARIRDELTAGLLKPLPLKEGNALWVQLYLIEADPDFSGPGVQRLKEIIQIHSDQELLNQG